MVSIELIDKYATAFGEFSVAISALFGAIVFFFVKRQEQIDRDNGTYASLDEAYVRYLFLAIKNPDLPLLADQFFDNRSFIAEQQYRLRCCYLVLISLLERAYKLYRGVSNENRKQEWCGWESYIREYLAFEPFAKEWPLLSEQFRDDFVRHVNSLKNKDNKKC